MELDPRELLASIPKIRETMPAVFIGLFVLAVFVGGGFWAWWLLGQ